MAWVNETEPSARGGGWSSDYGTKQNAGFSTYWDWYNGATSADDIFDPSFTDAGLHTHRLRFTTYASSGREYYISANFGTPKRIRKWRLRNVDTPDGGAQTSGVVRLLGSFNGSNWTVLAYMHVWQLTKTHRQFTEVVFNNPESYQYYKISMQVAGLHRRTHTLGGWDLFSGWFDTELEEEEYTQYVVRAIEPNTIHSPNFTSGNDPLYAFDGDYATYFETPNTNSYLSVSLTKPELVNFIKFRLSPYLAATNRTIKIHGSLDGENYTEITPVDVDGLSHTQQWDNPLDLRGINYEEYQHYRIDFGGVDSAIRLHHVELAHYGKFCGLREDLPPRNILTSSTYPMLIADREPLECSGSIGAVTSSEEGEGLYLNRIYREPLEAEGYCGAIGGEFDWETEDFYIEREISAQAFISPFADFPMLARDMNGLAGFGRQGNGAITIRHSVEGNVGEFALMDDATRSRYEMEGHCGTRAEMARRLTVDAFALPGVASNATVYLRERWLEGFVGANFNQGVPERQVVSSGMQHDFAAADVALPSYALSGGATVSGAGTLSQSIPSRFLDASATVHGYGDGRAMIPARYMSSSALVGLAATLSLDRPAYEVQAGGVSDIGASLHSMRSGYVLSEARTSGARFENFILQYEVPR